MAGLQGGSWLPKNALCNAECCRLNWPQSSTAGSTHLGNFWLQLFVVLAWVLGVWWDTGVRSGLVSIAGRGGQVQLPDPGMGQT